MTDVLDSFNIIDIKHKVGICYGIIWGNTRSYPEGKGLTQTDIARRMTDLGFSVSTNAVCKWETNYSKPSVLQFFGLCEILSIHDINSAFHVAEEPDPNDILNDLGKERIREYTGLLSRDERFTKKEA